MRELLRLAGLSARDRWRMLAAVLLGFLTIAAGVGLMATSAYLISLAALAPAIGDLWLAIVGVRFFGILRGVARYLERCVSHEVTFSLLARLRTGFYRALEPLAPARLQAFRSGDLQSRIVADIETLEQFYVGVLGPCAVTAMAAGMVGWVLCPYGWPIGASAVAVMLLTALGSGLVSLRVGRIPGRCQVALRSEMRTRLVEGFQGAADLLAFDGLTSHADRIRRASNGHERASLRMASARGLGGAMTALGTDACIVLLLILSVPLVREGALDGVYLAVIVLTVSAAFEAVAPIPAAFHALEKSLAASRRLFDILDAAPPVPEPSGPRQMPRPFDLCVRGLHFAYPAAPDVGVLNGLDLDLAAGRKLALVGPNGSGKSTLVHLLLRFWDYERGRIELSGADLRSLSAAEVRSQIGVVSQSTYLFAGTIADNIRLGRPDASVAQVVEAAARSGLYDFVDRLDDGYDTWIGEWGTRLSGGERQRLALARAVMMDTPVLILDEPTANLDAVTAAGVYRELRAFAQDRAVLMITHRVINLDWLDEVNVMVGGRVVERGTARDLHSQEGVFRKMLDTQILELDVQPALNPSRANTGAAHG